MDLYIPYRPPGVRGSPERGTVRYPRLGYTLNVSRRTLVGVQRLFSIFPGGGPGFALLLMRASVATALLLESLPPHHGPSQWIMGASLLAALALCIGFLTPIAAVITLGLHVLIWSSLRVWDPSTAAIIALDALALAFLGPGAYSIDSRRFGRREVVLPPDP
jgi:uncharacterized membrane protein YphA (DoxX/SURF4 family)